jgi:2-oxoglutarate ferredoxin oxidoreductase subunit delta
MAEYQVVIEDKRCKGCAICVQVCNKDCIEISESFNQGGYFYPAIRPDQECTGCGACVKLCPDFAVTVFEVLDETG